MSKPNKKQPKHKILSRRWCFFFIFPRRFLLKRPGGNINYPGFFPILITRLCPQDDDHLIQGVASLCLGYQPGGWSSKDNPKKKLLARTGFLDLATTISDLLGGTTATCPKSIGSWAQRKQQQIAVWTVFQPNFPGSATTNLATWSSSPSRGSLFGYHLVTFRTRLP